MRIESGDKFVHQNGISAPNIIKIDVQGAEKRIIDGFRSTLSNKNCRIVYCEVHENHVDTDNIKREFESMGFNIRTLERETDTIKTVR